MSIIEELAALEDRLPRATMTFEERVIGAAASAHPPHMRRRRWALGLSLAAALLIGAVVAAGLLRSHTKPPPATPGPIPPKTFRHPGEVAMPVRGVGIVGIDPRTGARRTLAACVAPCTAVDDPIWSADGQYLLFREFPGKPSGQPVAYLVGQGRPALPLAVPGLDFTEFLMWSPKGATIAVSGGHNGKSEIWLFDAATGRARAFARGFNITFSDTLAVWSPDGRAIAYSADRYLFSGEPGEGQVLVVQPIDGAPRAVAIANGERGAIWPAWSPDGRHLFVGSGVVDAQAPQPVEQPARINGAGATWSPDGRLIATTVGPAVAVSRPDGTRIATIRLPTRWAQAPSWPVAWSADSRQIAVPTPNGTYVVRADGGGKPRLTSAPEAFAWFQRPGTSPVMILAGGPQPEHPFSGPSG
jgi:hypothetical protein